MDVAYHYPPELMSLLIETIPRLCRSKKDVLLFFRGAGVSEAALADLTERVTVDRNAVSKAEIARSILGLVNEGGDRAIQQRREILKRVTQFEDFSVCWDNDRLVAIGLVEQVRRVVGVKDAFTRMQIERESERKARQQEQKERLQTIQRRREDLSQVKSDLFALFPERDANKRGKQLESVLTRLFEVSGILVREPFTLKGRGSTGVVEQVDGAIEFGAHLYLVEMKWWADALGPAEVAPHLVRVFSRHEARGLLISASGYTEAALQQCREALAQKVIVLSRLEEIVRLLEREGDLSAWLKAKTDAAIADKTPLFEPAA
jgi:restriction system protein